LEAALGQFATSATQQEAKQIIDANTADDNTALMHLAERLIQQQDAAVIATAAIRAARVASSASDAPCRWTPLRI
jgi:hypothetical protein